MAGPVSVLPRFIALKGDNGMYLELKSDGMLAFEATEITRLATHEVLYNSDDPQSSFLIRSQNQHFWRRDATGWIRADRDPASPPSATESTARFKLAHLSSDRLALQSAAADGLYLKRLRHDSLHGYAAWVASPDAYTPVEVSDAWESAVSIPRHIFIVGDNGKYLHTSQSSAGQSYHLAFHGEDGANLYGISEVVPLLDGSIALYNPKAQCFWEIYGLFHQIWVGATTIVPSCYFEPVKLGATILALRSKPNNYFCGRLMDANLLMALFPSTSETRTHLRISEANNARYVFDCNYLLGLASTTGQTPVAVADGTVINDSNYTTDLTVTVTQRTELHTSRTFSNSFSFTQSVSTSFKTGIPFFAEGKLEVEIGFEQSFSNEWNTTTTKGLDFSASYLVKDVPPGGRASVTVICSTGKMRIPFTYRSKDTAPDGTDRPSVLYVDGIFEGVDAYKIEAVISNGPTSYVAPGIFKSTNLAKAIKSAL